MSVLELFLNRMNLMIIFNEYKMIITNINNIFGIIYQEYMNNI